MQNKQLEIIYNEQIALEVLPISSVRVSCYKSYREHHICRWLNRYSKYRPIVLMGSDELGLFSTTLANEYTHICINGKTNSDFDAGDAMLSVIKEIADNGKLYGFYQ